MSRIIVGVDGSSRSEDAIAFARRLADTTGASLEIVSAFPYEDWPGYAAAYEYREFLREQTEAMLDRTRAALELPDVVAHAIADPSPARALHTLAEQDGADLIVVGSSHRGRVGRALIGGTAQRLLHGSPCPVAVVPVGWASDTEIDSVGVGYDGSPEAEAALDAAFELARRLGATLWVIRVFDAATIGTPALMGGPGYVPAYKEIERLAREHLERRVAALPDDLRAEGLFVAGAPGRELATRSEGLDLLLLGSRGYGPLRSVLLGGVSRVVVGEAACPVIVLPRGGRGDVGSLFAQSTAAGA